MYCEICWPKVWDLSCEEEVQISSNSRLGFLFVWGFRFAWKKEAVTWQKVQCSSSRRTLQRNAKCNAMHGYHVAAAVKRNAAKSFAVVVGEKNLFFLLLSIDGFPPPPFNWHIGWLLCRKLKCEIRPQKSFAPKVVSENAKKSRQL